MENIQNLLTILSLATSGLLIGITMAYNSLAKKYNQEIQENAKIKNAIYHVENAVYDIKDLEGKDRPKLYFNQIISDIINFRTLANKYQGIKPEYEELVEKHKIAEALRNYFRNSEFTKKFISKNMPNELIAIELLKGLKNKDLVINANNSKIVELEKRNHAKDQTICSLRKKKGVKAPKKNKRKTGHKEKI